MEPLRALLLLAATADIEIQGVWLASKDNGLADALSRFNATSITNWCPHWQDSVLIRLPIFRRNQVRHRQNTPDSFGTAWILPPARAINRQSSPTKHSAPLTAMLLGPLQKLYWASGLLPAHSAPPLFKIWEESSQIRGVSHRMWPGPADSRALGRLGRRSPLIGALPWESLLPSVSVS